MQWDNVISMVQDLHLESRPDRWGWILDVTDSFSVSSARSFLDGGMVFSGGEKT